MKIPVTRPFFDDCERETLASILDSGWVVQGSMVAEFERLFSIFTGAGFAIATTSCTTALHLSLVAAGIGPGHEVIVPSFTFVATANAVEHAGAKPVFCDIDPDTFNMAAEDVERLISGKTRAIIPVHLFGLCADMDGIMEIATEHGVTVIEDAACAMGSLYRGQHAGGFGLTGCFSFHPRKVVTTGEGGMIITNDMAADKLLRSLRDHGASMSDLERGKTGVSLLPLYDSLGYNYRMTDLQGALGVCQMKKVEWVLEERKKRAEIYNESLTEVEWLKTPVVPDGFTHSYQSYVCMIDKGCFHESIEDANRFRNGLMERLERKGIATRQGTHAVHTLGYYRGKYAFEERDLPCSLEADRLSLALPIYPQMTDEEQEYVIKQLIVYT